MLVTVAELQEYQRRDAAALWERGDRKPRGRALVPLRVIDKEGRAVLRANNTR